MVFLTDKEKKEQEKILSDIMARTKNVKTKVSVPTLKDRIFHTRNQGRGTKYFTTGRVVGHVRDLDKEPNPYKTSGKIMMGVWRVEGSERKSYMRNTVRGRQIGNVLERVFVEEETMPIPAITDLDPEFYTIIRGRTTIKRFKRKEYMEGTREIFKANLESALIQDHINWIKEQDKALKTAIKDRQLELKMTARCFNMFLEEEGLNTLQALEDEKKVSDATRDKTKELEERKERLQMLKYGMIKEEERLKRYKKSGDMLYELSSDEWKKEYAEMKERWLDETQGEREKLKTALAEYREAFGGVDTDTESMIEKYIENVSSKGPVKIGFDEPEEVLVALMELRDKNVESCLKIDKLKEPSRKAFSIMVHTLNFYTKKLERAEKEVDEAERKLAEDKQKVQRVRIMADRLTEGVFRELVSSEEVLRELALVKDLYESVVGGSREDLTALEMLKAVEAKFVEVETVLSREPARRIKRIERDIKAWDRKKMEEAKWAKRRSREITWMVEGLKKAYKPIIEIDIPPPGTSRSAGLTASRPTPSLPRTPTFLAPQIARDHGIFFPLVNIKLIDEELGEPELDRELSDAIKDEEEVSSESED